MPIRFFLVSFLAALWMTDCSQRKTHAADSCFTVATRLDQAWRALLEARGPDGSCRDPDGRDRCQATRWEIERLAMSCPAHGPAQFATATFAFEDGNLARAQQTLDAMMADQQAHPEAEILRARIALAQGNVPFAIRFLRQKVEITGDHPGLREALASALYLAQRYGEAAGQLEIASRLGAPAYRIAFHSGLLHEAGGDLDRAIAQYELALKTKPGWQAAESRLRALKARR